MLLDIYPSGMFETNAILLGCSKTKKVVCIDPAPGSAKKFLKAIEENGFEPIGIFLTHSHWDHIADAANLQKELHVPIYIHPEDAGNLEEPGSDGLPMLMHIEAAHPDHLLQDGEILYVGEMRVEVIHTPGHTPGGVCFYIPEEKTLISGDTLFKGTIGNLSFPTARAKRMWESLKKLAKLPPETRVYPGHGDPTTIGDENWLDQAEQIFYNS